MSKGKRVVTRRRRDPQRELEAARWARLSTFSSEFWASPPQCSWSAWRSSQLHRMKRLQRTQQWATNGGIDAQEVTDDRVPIRARRTALIA